MPALIPLPMGYHPPWRDQQEHSPCSLLEMKEQLQARGRLCACSCRRAAALLPGLRLERMQAHTSAPARVFALLFRGCD